MLRRMILVASLAMMVTPLVPSDAARILFLSPPFISQCKIDAPIGEELVSRGHEVFTYLPIQLDADKCYKGTGVTVLTYDMGKENWDLLQYVAKQPSLLAFRDIISVNCRGMFVGKEHDIEKLSKYNFDIAFVNLIRYSRCYGIIPRKFGIPYVSFGSAQFPHELGKPFLPNIETLPITTYPTDMAFHQRLLNTIFSLMFLVIDPLLLNQPVEKEILPTGMTYDEITTGAELYITDQSLFLNGAVPYSPNILNLGSFTTKDPEKLTGDLEKFVSRRWKGVIIVSFGSIITDTSNSTTAAIEHVASKLGDYGFIWKTGSTSLKGNIFRTTWLPQNDVLGHKMTKLFIHHCGRGGWYEALYHAVPIVCIPCNGDQFYNAAVAQRRGYGLVINDGSVKSEILEQFVDDVLTNEHYSQNIQRDSAIYRDIYREPAGKAAAGAIEHVIKFGGKHFRPATYELSFLSLTMLDVWCVLLGGLFFVLWLIVTCLRKIFSKIRGRSDRKSKSD